MFNVFEFLRFKQVPPISRPPTGSADVRRDQEDGAFIRYNADGTKKYLELTDEAEAVLGYGRTPTEEERSAFFGAAGSDLYVTPETYGAEGCVAGYSDITTQPDDTDAIEAALAASGGKILLLTKNYRITRPIDFVTSGVGRRVHGRYCISSAFTPDNSAGGFDSAGYAVKIGNTGSNWVGSYGCEIREFYLRMQHSPGISGIYCSGTVGEQTNLYRVTIRQLASDGSNPVYGIYVGNFVQNFDIHQLWITAGSPSSYTVGVRMPKGRSCSIRNVSIAANTCIDLDGDGVFVQGAHFEGANTEPHLPYGIYVKARTQSGQEQPRVAATIVGVHGRGCAGGTIYIDDTDAAVNVFGICDVNAEHRARISSISSVADVVTVVTATAHGFSGTDSCKIAGVTGGTNPNGVKTITVIDATSFRFTESGEGTVGAGSYGGTGVVGEPDAYEPLLVDNGFSPANSTAHPTDHANDSTILGYYMRSGSDEDRWTTNDPNLLLARTSIWNEVQVPMGSFILEGSNDPGFAKVTDDGGGSTGVFGYHFDKDAEEEVYFVVPIPRSWLSYNDAGNIRAYFTWAPSTTDSGDVVWGLEYTWADQGEAFGASTILTAIASAGGTDNEKRSVAFSQISGTGKENGSMLLCRAFRQAASGDDDYGADAILLGATFYFGTARLGCSDGPPAADVAVPLDGVAGQVFGVSMRPLVTGGSIGTAALWADQLGSNDLSPLGGTPPVRGSDSWDCGTVDGYLAGAQATLTGEHWFFLVVDDTARTQFGMFNQDGLNNQHWGIKTDLGNVGFYHRYTASNWAYYTTGAGVMQGRSVVTWRWPADGATAPSLWINGVAQALTATVEGSAASYLGNLVSVAGKLLSCGYGGVASGNYASPGPYYEIFILSGEHSADRAAIEVNMATKWGVGVSPDL